MDQAGLAPLLSNPAHKYDDVAYKHAMYLDIASKPAYKDLVFKIKELKEGMEKRLIQDAGLDKWGNPHDNEIRAVIHCLNTILYYISSVKEDFDKAQVNLEKFNRRRDAIDPFVPSNRGLGG